MPVRRRTPLGPVQPLDDRITPDVGDTLALALPTGLAGPGAFAVAEPLGDGTAGSKDVDLFALTAAAGQRLTVLTTANAVGGTATNTHVRVFDAAGVPLASNNDFAGTFSRLTVTLPAAGGYFVGVSGSPNTGYNPAVAGSGTAGATGDYTLSVGLAAAVPWTARGASIQNGQVEGMTAQGNPVSGAAQALVPHPTNPDILWAATTNGGVWRTDTATASSPTWTPLTDRLGSLSMGALERDPTDPTSNTLVAGFGRTSSLGRDGGAMLGLIRTTDGGTTWSSLTSGLPTTEYVRGIAARGATIVAGFRAASTGIYRSTDTGGSFTKITGAAGTGLPAGGVFDLASDPGDPARLYALTTSGVFRSDDTGATWADVTPAGVASQLAVAGNARIAVHNNAAAGTNAVYFGYTVSGYIRTVFRSAAAGAGWVSMGVPGTDYPTGTITGATDASPIVVTDPGHGLATGSRVSVSGVRGNTAANGVWAVTVLTANTFALDGSTGNGTYTGGGTWSRAYPITGATSPGLITITAPAHGLSTGAQVTVEGVQGNTAANGTWVVTRVDADRFSLDYSLAGATPYTGGGTWRLSEGLQPVEGEQLPDKVEDYAGGQGDIHFSIAADPVSSTVVYFGGDRQGLPSSIGAQNFTGRLFRGDAALPSGNQWTPLTHVGTSNNSAPHADSRDLEFDANGQLVEGDDGGVYRHTSPRTTTGQWVAAVGNMVNTESHSGAYDPVNGAFTIGTQDVGSARSGAAGGPWLQVNQGDGGDTQISVNAAGTQSTRYSSSQYLGGFRRQVYNAAGTLVSTTSLATVSDSQFYGPYVIHATDPTRLALGGGTNLYESNNQGGSWAVAVASTGTIRSLALGHPQNADAFFAGSTTAANRFLVRESAAGGIVNRTAQLPGTFGTIARYGITLDPDDWRTVYVATTNGRVWRTTDAGATLANWTDLTGDLLGRLGTARGGAWVVDGAAADTLLVSGNNGVFATSTTVPGAWYEVGAETLPNAPAYDLKWSARGDTLSLATLGRGVWSVGGVAARFDTTAPAVTTVTRAATSPASTPTVAFTVSFSEPVAGLTAGNFSAVVGAGLTGAGGIVSVLPSATGAAWTVVVAAGVGSGTLGLDWTSNAGVVDLAGNPLGGGPVVGEAYTIARPRPTVTGVQVNDGGPQRSRVLRLTVSFSAAVNLGANAFTLTRASDGATLTSAAGGIVFTPPGAGGATSVVLTFVGANTEAGSLADGRWTLGLLGAAVTDAATGVAAADSTGPAVTRLFGDVTGEGEVNADDLTEFASAFGTSAGDAGFRAALDFDGGGQVNADDLTEFASRFGVAV